MFHNGSLYDPMKCGEMEVSTVWIEIILILYFFRMVLSMAFHILYNF